jgi:hypothetical protein
VKERVLQWMKVLAREGKCTTEEEVSGGNDVTNHENGHVAERRCYMCAMTYW